MNENYKLFYEVPAALMLTAISAMTGLVTIMDIADPQIPNFILPTPVSAAICLSSGLGAKKLWRNVKERVGKYKKQ